MNHALGEVDSDIIKEARDSHVKVIRFMLKQGTDYKSDLFKACQYIDRLFDECEFRKLNSLAELCKTVFINQNHAECIKQLRNLSKRIDELQETK